jgi:hypothetical protein
MTTEANVNMLEEFWFSDSKFLTGSSYERIDNTNTSVIESNERAERKLRNYVRKERYNEFELLTSRTFLEMADQIERLTKMVNEVYYPMKKGE